MSLALADAHRLQQVRLSTATAGLVGELYRRLVNPLDLDATFPAFVRATELVVGKGRAASWQFARDYHVAEAASHGVKITPASVPLRRMGTDQMNAAMHATGAAVIERRLRDGGNLRDAATSARLATMGSAKRLILNGGREYLVEASMLDPGVAAYARITDGAPCHFCAMLVSRGPVYSATTAAFQAHDHCGCNVRLVYPDDPDGGWSEQAKALRAMWEENGDVNTFRAALARSQSPRLPAGKLTPAEARVRGLIPPEIFNTILDPDRALLAAAAPVPPAPAPAPAAKPWVAAVAKAAEALPGNRHAIGVKTAAGKLVDDLDAMGKLGPETAAALDAILDAGKALDEELSARIAKRFPTDPAAAYDAARAEYHERTMQLLDPAASRDPNFRASVAELEKLRKRTTDLAVAAREARQVQAAAWREELRAILGDIRDVGGGPRAAFTGPRDLVEALHEAHTVYPTEWNDRVTAAFPQVRVIKTARGYNRGGYEIALSEDRSLPGRPYGHVAVHELGHSMEEAVPGLRGAEWAFLYRRSDKRVTKAGKESLKGRIGINGSSKEKAYADKWADQYTGRTYQATGGMAEFRPATGALNSWEVFTTGIESLTEGSRYFTRGATLGGDDAEFRQFILGVLSVL